MVGQISPCLWFDYQAEEAAKFYVSVFKNSSIDSISRYTAEGKEIHGQDEGMVLTVAFKVNGQTFTALNGGPLFKFNEAVSFQVFCENQEEIDYYWDQLTAGGGEEGQCGWLKDRFGVSWQIIPDNLQELLSDPSKKGKVTNAFMQMKKLVISELLNA